MEHIQKQRQQLYGIAEQLKDTEPEWSLALRSFATLMVVPDRNLSVSIAETVTDYNQKLGHKIIITSLGDVDHG